jgi:enolase
MKISQIYALQVLDSRGNPTIKGYVKLENGIVGSACVPSGASTGSHEALELRDKNSKKYHGLGVEQAIQNINTIISGQLNGFEIEDLQLIDTTIIQLDGTENKSKLGANAILAVSLAAARALSLHQNTPLWETIHAVYFSNRITAFPRLMVNIVNGGAHANWVLDFQECMICPKSTQPSESVRIASEVFHSLKSLLKTDGYTIAVGDEGGFAPLLASNGDAFKYLEKAILDAGHSREVVDLATDIAASEFFSNGLYKLKKENAEWQSSNLMNFYLDLIEEYNIFSFEDPFQEDDWSGFAEFTEKVGAHRMIVGDDLYVTNIKRIQEGIEKKASNAVLIKVNQIGSLYETVEAIRKTQEAGWKVVISHRSGETEDSFIADLAYACGAEFIKTGSMSRSDRLSKYNRLLEIEALEV